MHKQKRVAGEISLLAWIYKHTGNMWIAGASDDIDVNKNGKWEHNERQQQQQSKTTKWSKPFAKERNGNAQRMRNGKGTHLIT